MKMYLKTACLTVFFLGIALLSFGQETKLAAQYFSNGEYEKAAVLYKNISDKSTGSNYYFNYYIKSLIAMKDIDSAEKALKSAINKDKSNSELYVTYGDMLISINEPEKAAVQYRNGIDNLTPDVSKIMRLANAFIRSTKYDLAEETYEKGIDLMGNDAVFAMNLADLYRRTDQQDKMLYYYLSSVRNNPNNVRNIKNNLHRYLTPEGYEELKKQLYANIQEYPDEVTYVELLEWTFIQEKDYGKAFRQARSLDRKLGEDGKRVMDLANLAMNDKSYDSAIKAFQYITEDKGSTSTYYVSASKSILKCKQASIMEDFVYTQQDLDTLDYQYQSFVDQFGINTNTASMVREYASFLALYRGNIDKAIGLLEEMKNIRGLPREQLAFVKLDLADYYLINENIWEATLLYSQVDKAHKEEHVGELARMRNAQFSYFTGDFEWAQAQFDILKAATSKLISNDAIDRSVFIMDNLGLDTTAVPLQMYAEAELLAFQNKYDESFGKLDSILVVFPEHGLKDDILYTKAKIYRKQGKFNKAKQSYMTIIEEFPEDIRCDNSIYELAEMYEMELKKPDKAMELYEKLFIDYSNSTFAIDARKNFRRLRGDDIQ